MSFLSRDQNRRLALLIAALSAAVLLVSPPGFVQDVPDEAAAEAEADEATQEDGESHITIGLGTMRQRVDGNPLRFRQYLTPPSALHVSLVDVDHPLNEAGLVFGVRAEDLLEPSAGGVGYLYEVDQGVRVDSRYRRSEFYRDFYLGSNHLTRTDWQTDARWRISPRDHFMGGYGTTHVRGGIVGDAADHWRSETWRGTYTRTIGDVNAFAGLRFEQFNFGSPEPYFSGEATTWNLGFGPSRDSDTLIGGTISVTSTDLDGQAISPQTTSISLTGLQQLSDDLSVTGSLEYWELEDAIEQNAYAQRERLASIEGEWSGLPRTVIRAGFESAEVDYVNGRQLQVVEPAVNTGTINVRLRPCREVKLQADVRRRRVDDRPLAYTVGGTPTTTLIYSQADMMRFRGTWTPEFAPIGLTFGYREDERENENQGTANTVVTRDLSAWWNARDDLSLTASLMNQSYGLTTSRLATPFVSDAEYWSVGATWQAAERTTVSASFSRADSFGAIELAQQIWSASVEHSWKTHTVRLGVTLDDLDDYNGTLLGYDADLWYAEFSTLLP